jgi:arylsulfatase
VCGADTRAPVIFDYKPPFRFTGQLHSATVDASGAAVRDYAAEFRIALARQ